MAIRFITPLPEGNTPRKIFIRNALKYAKTLRALGKTNHEIAKKTGLSDAVIKKYLGTTPPELLKQNLQRRGRNMATKVNARRALSKKAAIADNFMAYNASLAVSPALARIDDKFRQGAVVPNKN